MYKFNYLDFQNTIDELRREIGFDGTFDSHKFIAVFRAKYEHVYISCLNQYSNDGDSNNAIQTVNSQIAKYLSENSASLNIVKKERLFSDNDHGKSTENQGWKLLSMLILLMTSFMPIKVLAQINAGELSINYTKTTNLFYADSSYIESRISILNDLSNQLTEKKTKFDNTITSEIYNELYQARKDQFRNNNIPYYGFLPGTGALLGNLSGKYDKKKLRSQIINDIDFIKSNYQKIIGVELGENEIIKTNEGECFKMNLLNDIYTDSIPVNKHIIITKDATNQEYQDFKKRLQIRDEVKIKESYRWIYREDGSRFNDLMEKRAFHFPIEVEYYVHPDHSNYAVKMLRPNGYREYGYISYSDLLFDMRGTLVAFANDFYNCEGEINKLKNLIYTQDFRANKYNIQSEDKLTKQYIEMILNGKLDSLRCQALGTTMAIAFADAVVSNYEIDPKDKRQIETRAKQLMNRNVVEFINSIDKTKMQRAQQYIEQLEADHDGSFEIGRKKRINANSYNMSLVNNEGKVTYILKFEYLPSKPFTAKLRTTVQSFSGKDIILANKQID